MLLNPFCTMPYPVQNSVLRKLHTMRASMQGDPMAQREARKRVEAAEVGYAVSVHDFIVCVCIGIVVSDKSSW